MPEKPAWAVWRFTDFRFLIDRQSRSLYYRVADYESMDRFAHAKGIFHEYYSGWGSLGFRRFASNRWLSDSAGVRALCEWRLWFGSVRRVLSGNVSPGQLPAIRLSGRRLSGRRLSGRHLCAEHVRSRPKFSAGTGSHGIRTGWFVQSIGLTRRMVDARNGNILDGNAANFRFG